MTKNGKYGIGVVLVLALFVQISLACAAEGIDEAKTKLNDVRKEISQAKFEYQQETQKVTRTYDDRLADIKKEFHKKRDECLNEKKAKLDELTGGYKSKIAPMQAEEKRLLEIMIPTQGMNFAKPKADRK